MDKEFDAIIVGAGFAGSSCARLLADAGKKVLVLEERNTLGGNSCDSYDKNGILIHPYGPHIFHTNNKDVFDFLSRFTEWIPYKHRVLGNIDGIIVPIPFNFKSIDLLFSFEKADRIKKLLQEHFSNRTKVSIYELLESSNLDIKAFGEYVYDKVFAQYTAKQWGTKVENVDRSVLNRVPVVIGYEDLYFSDTFQYMPKFGFDILFKNMLNHKNIKVLLNKKSEELLFNDGNNLIFQGEKFNKPVIYTGEIDRFFNYRFGHLPYRSLDFVFKNLNIESFQEVGVVNYNTSEKYTRITEFKKLTGQKSKKTTILFEYPKQFGEEENLKPYYPISNTQNIELYKKYSGLAGEIPNFYCCGRLAEYSYYNMDKTVERAIAITKEILEK